MELRRYLAILQRHWRALIVIPVVAALVAFLATYVVSPRYESEVTIQLIPDQVEPRTITLRSQGGPNTVALGLKDPTELLAQSIIENLTSREVIAQIVTEMEIEHWPEPQGFDAFKSSVRGAIGDLFTLARYGYIVRLPKREAAIAVVGRTLDAELVRGSYYMHITAQWNDPEIASEIANRAVVALSAHIRSVANKAGLEQSDFLKTQVDEAKGRVDAARQQLLDYSKTSGAVGSISLIQALDAREQAREALRQNDLNLASMQAQLQVLQAQLNETAPTIVTNRTVADSNSNDSGSSIATTEHNLAWDTAKDRVQQLEQDVSALETREWYSEAEFKASIATQLADARRRLQIATEQQAQSNDFSPLVRDSLREQVLILEQQVAALDTMLALSFEEMKLRNGGLLADTRRRLEVARQQLAGTPTQLQSDQLVRGSSSSTTSTTETSAVNPVYQDLEQQAALLLQQRDSFQALRDKLVVALQAREAEVVQLAAQDGQLAALNQELELATSIYTERAIQWSESLVEAARPASQMRLIDASVPPVYPIRPIKYRWMLIGLAAGLALATIYVFVRHTTDLRVRTADDVEAALGLGLLAVVPTGRAARL